MKVFGSLIEDDDKTTSGGWSITMKDRMKMVVLKRARTIGGQLMMARAIEFGC